MQRFDDGRRPNSLIGCPAPYQYCLYSSVVTGCPLPLKMLGECLCAATPLALHHTPYACNGLSIVSFWMCLHQPPFFTFDTARLVYLTQLWRVSGGYSETNKLRSGNPNELLKLKTLGFRGQWQETSCTAPPSPSCTMLINVINRSLPIIISNN